MRRQKKKKSLIAPIKQNLVDRLSNAGARHRRYLVRGLVVFVAVFLVWSFFSGDFGFIRIAKEHLKAHNLEKENQEILIKLVDSEQRIERLKTDYQYIEYIARTRHYLSRPGEVIYRFR